MRIAAAVAAAAFVLWGALAHAAGSRFYVTSIGEPVPVVEVEFVGGDIRQGRLVGTLTGYQNITVGVFELDTIVPEGSRMRVKWDGEWSWWSAGESCDGQRGDGFMGLDDVNRALGLMNQPCTAFEP